MDTVDTKTTELGRIQTFLAKQERNLLAYKIADIVALVMHYMMYLPLAINFLFVIGTKAERKMLRHFFGVPFLRGFYKSIMKWLNGLSPEFIADASKYLKWFIIAALLLWVVPTLMHLILRLILSFVLPASTKCHVDENTTQSAKETCLYGKQLADQYYRMKEIPVFKIAFGVGALVGAWDTYLIYVISKAGGEEISLPLLIFGSLLLIAFMGAAACILTIPFNWIRNGYRIRAGFFTKIRTETQKADDLWVQSDPEEKKRRDEQAKREREEAERRRKQAAASSYSSSGSSSTRIIFNYDDSIDVYGNLTVTFYIDGTSHRIRPGRNTFPVSTGFHRLNCTVYDDGSESATRLPELTCNLSYGQEYEIDFPE